MIRLTYEREKRGWSQLTVARKLGVKSAYISNIERKKNYSYPKIKQALVELFQLKPEILFQEIEIKEEVK